MYKKNQSKKCEMKQSFFLFFLEVNDVQRKKKKRNSLTNDKNICIIYHVMMINSKLQIKCKKLK